MTQRIFDIENEKDMADLWDILPDDAIKVIKILFWEKQSFGCKVFIEGEEDFGYNLECININWHGKTEITRPIQECTEADIGKICCFWNEDTDYSVFGFLTKVTPHIIEANKSIYQFMNEKYYKHCRRLTKQEIEELI